MGYSIAKAGSVIGTFLALLQQLQSFQDKIRLNNEDFARLDRIVQRLASQRASFEDVTLELLYEFGRSADLAEFFRAPQDERWSAENLETQADHCLDVLLKEFGKISDHIKNLLIDFQRETEDITISALNSNRSLYSNPLPSAMLLKRLFEPKNETALQDIVDNNEKLKDTMNRVYHDRQNIIRKSEITLCKILELMASSEQPQSESELTSLCKKIRQEELAMLEGVKLATVEPSLTNCLSKDASCYAGSNLPYDSLKMLTLRWFIVHISLSAGYKSQRCCWKSCPDGTCHPHLHKLLHHVITCKHVNYSQYRCLASMERAWYDNRRAWQTNTAISDVTHPTWPSNCQEFEKKQDPPLEVDNNFPTHIREGTTISSVKYRGILLVRKTMKWKTDTDLDDHRKESAHLHRLKHPHIIQLFGFYKQHKYYSMLLYPRCESTLADFMEKQCEAESIDKVLSDKDLRLDRLYLESFFPCLAQALKYIHSHVTRHMDIKSDNILVKHKPSAPRDGRRYHVYIADFGTSSTFTSLSQTTAWTGKTYKYCAPEVAANDSRNIHDQPEWGRPADVFSLGCVFAEMLTTLACREITLFDSYRAGTRSIDGAEIRRMSGDVKNESFHANLPRVRAWLEDLRGFQDADHGIQSPDRGYWYRRGDHLAFANWKTTFTETITVTQTMLEENQRDRPRIAEVLKRFNIDQCCNDEVIPICQWTG